MSTNKVWHECNKVGNKGEELFKDAMQARGHKVFDVRDIKEYQKKDIDYLVQKRNTNKKYSFEIKSDSRMWETGNFVVEKWENLNKSKGWFYKCKARFLVICDVEREILYMFKFSLLRDYVAEYGDELRLITYREQSYDNSNNYCTRQYWLVNMDKFIKYCEDNGEKVIDIDMSW